jgi:hypothetical protein
LIDSRFRPVRGVDVSFSDVVRSGDADADAKAGLGRV